MQSLRKVSQVLFRAFFITADNITRFVYRISKGAVGHGQAGLQILVINTIGRKTGLVRAHSLLYAPINGNWVVIASNGGNDRHPAWYLNLAANANVTIQVGRKRYQVMAAVAAGVERDKLWRKLLKIWPLYAHYQRGTDRTFPIIVLRKLEDEVDLS